jgi:uncharacterized protein YecE (DUF72 family)
MKRGGSYRSASAARDRAGPDSPVTLSPVVSFGRRRVMQIDCQAPRFVLPFSRARHRFTERTMKPNVSIGPAGWSYPDWVGAVYPADGGGRFDRLAYLAGYFDLVEINSTFYRIPSRATSRGWADRVAFNPDFLFSVKAHQSMTHAAQSPDAGVAEAFKAALEPIHDSGRLGFVLLQFPWSFRFTAPARERIRLLNGSLRPYPLALEVRHGTWECGEALDFVGGLGMTLCGIDQPQLGHSLTPNTSRAGPQGAYFRFHGRNAKEWFNPETNRDLRYNYLYSTQELEPWVKKIKQVVETCSSVFVVLNNHFRGQAAVNALELKSLLQGRPVRVPQSLRKAYPRLETVAARDTEGERPRGSGLQRSLFDDEDQQKQDGE